MLQNDLGSYVQDAINSGSASSASGLQKVLEIQRDWILNKGAGISENFDYTYGELISALITSQTVLRTSVIAYNEHS